MQLDWKRLFLTADGRIGRQDFWIGFAILFAANIVLSWIPFLGFLVMLAVLYAQVCLGAKRLHDFGKSGWLMLVPTLVVFACLILAGITFGMSMIGAAATGNDGAATAAALGGMGMMFGLFGLAFLVNIGFLLWMGLTASDPGENRYGPSPTPAFVNNPPASAPPPPTV